MVTISDPLVSRWAAAAAAHLLPHQTVLQRSPEQFRMFFREALSILQLDPDLFRPYSIRRGGATDFYIKSGSLDQLLLRGRWSDIRTARIYVQDGVAALTHLSLSPATQQRVTVLQAALNG